jgi:predicted nucleotide-binding protein
MAKINPALLAKIAKKLNVGDKRVYAIIQKRAHDSNVESHVASLLVARDADVNYARFAMPEDRAEMRNAGSHAPVHAQAPQGVAPSPRKAGPAPMRPVKTTKNNSVFVVHGRDEKLRNSMFDLLLRFGLNPLEWNQAIHQAGGGANPNIGRTINTMMKRAQAIIVMFSPDEQAKLKAKFCGRGEKTTLGKLADQARPNVLFEAGLALGAHPKKTLLVQIGKMRQISDIDGMHLLRLDGGPASRNDFAQRLRSMGFKVNTTGVDWMKVGDFKR